MAEIVKAANDGAYGSIKVYFENGFITHVENMQRKKPPIDIQKAEG